MNRALLIVDPQMDFISGSLPVPHAAKAMTGLAEYVKSAPYALRVITLDWHPWNHCSFSGEHGKWPVHCLAWSQGAALWPDLLESLEDAPEKTLVLTKGSEPDKEEYSIFQNASSKTELLAAFNRHGIEHADICGLTGDICVLNTLKDGITVLGKDFFTVLAAFSPSLDNGAALAGFCAGEAICVR